MNNKQIITKAWKKIVIALQYMRIDDELAELYTDLLKSLPETVLVEENFRDKDLYIQGIISLYTPEEFDILSEEKKRSRELAFSFGVDGQASINQSDYSGPQLFAGDWVGALEFIIDKMHSSNLRKNLSRGQRRAVEELIKQLTKN